MPALTAASEATETLTGSSEAAFFPGFYPGTALYVAPYPHPGSTSYPGPKIGAALTQTTEATETLTPATES